MMFNIQDALKPRESGLQSWELALVKRCIDSQVPIKIKFSSGNVMQGTPIGTTTDTILLKPFGGGTAREPVKKFIVGIELLGTFDPDGPVSGALWKAGRRVAWYGRAYNQGGARPFSTWNLTWNGQSRVEFADGELAQGILNRVVVDNFVLDLPEPALAVTPEEEQMVYFFAALWAQDMGL